MDELGDVWSGKAGRYGRWKKPHRIKPWTDRGGYKRVTLNGRKAQVHRLVAAAFNGPCPNGLVCEHIDGDPADNRPENLRYVTQAENLSRKLEHGTAVVGEKSPLAKLSDADAKHILELCAKGVLTRRAIAQQFNVAESTVHAIWTGRIRKHLHGGVSLPKDDRPPIRFKGKRNRNELRDIPGFPTYKAGADGRIWSFWDGKRSNRWPNPYPLKPHIQRDGYMEVRIRQPRGKYTNVQVHRLIALAWVGERPAGYVVHHQNGNRQDNRISNLEYVTVRANTLAMNEHGTMRRGHDCPKSRLTEAEANEILRHIRDGELNQKQIATKFGVTVGAVWCLKTGRTWKHLER